MRSLAVVLLLCGCTARPLETLGELYGAVEVAPGVPAPGATVSLPSLGRGTITNADGGFAFDAVPLGPQTLVVSAPSTLESVKLVDHMVDGAGQPVTVALTGLGLLTGKVLDEEQQPIGGAHVALGEAVGSSVTDSAGRFLLRVPVGTYTLVATAEGFSPASSGSLQVAWNKTTIADTTLVRGQARSLVEATILRVGTSDHSGTFVHLPGTPYTALTDSEGHFEIANVPDGLYSIAYQHGAFSDRIDDVLLSGGLLYRFGKQIEPLGTLELLSGFRLSRTGERTLALSPTEQLVLGPQRLGVVDLKGHSVFSDPELAPYVYAPSVSPGATHIYYPTAVRADGTQPGRLVRIADGARTEDSGWGWVVGWRSESEVVIARARAGDPPGLYELVRLDALAGQETPLTTLHATQLLGLGDSMTGSFFVIDDQRLERRSLSDGSLLWSKSDAAPIRCSVQRCVFFTGTYQVIFSDGAVVDTGIPVVVPVDGAIDLGAPYLMGAVLGFSYAQRVSVPWPQPPSGVQGSIAASSGGRWVELSSQGIALYLADASGLAQRFSTLLTETALVKFASDESAAVVTVLGDDLKTARLAWLSGATTSGELAIECPTCLVASVASNGALLQTGNGTFRSTMRFDAVAKTLTPLPTPPLAPPSGSLDRRQVLSDLGGMVWLTDAGSDAVTPLGHRLSLQRWIDANHLVVLRQDPPAGEFVLEVP